MTALAALLAERIRRFGPMTFAEYMRECLYHPTFGYYSQPETQRFADYYTSVDVNPIFGRLLARQFAEMWTILGQPEEFHLVEAAAGSGRLAGQVLDFLETKLPTFYRAVRYVAVERSVARSEQLSARLGKHIAAGKCRSSLDVPPAIAVGCVFSNELLDALPVHRVVRRGSALQEIFVIGRGDGFAEMEAPVSTCAIEDYFTAQAVQLEDGQQAEVGLEACDWITEIGRRLGRGFVVTIDYGHEAADLFDAHHTAGTLMSYANHQASEDYYVAPGEQDLTAHVNFTPLRLWGARVGLQAIGLVSQTAFLLALGRANDFDDLYDDGMGEPEKVRARLQLKTLIYPEGMGERFHVMIQEKGQGPSRLTGLSPL